VKPAEPSQPTQPAMPAGLVQLEKAQLERELESQAKELAATREELDFANQEIFNLRMKYSSLEKQRSNTITVPNMDSSEFDMDTDIDLGSTMNLMKKKLKKKMTTAASSPQKNPSKKK
jgi:predicted  nucleic acid-binding Zn-ribbon protein